MTTTNQKYVLLYHDPTTNEPRLFSNILSGGVVNVTDTVSRAFVFTNKNEGERVKLKYAPLLDNFQVVRLL